jgi:hypothetical protein
MDFNSELIPKNLRPEKNDTGFQRWLESFKPGGRTRQSNAPGLGNSNPSAGSVTPTTTPSLSSSTSIQSSSSIAQTETRSTSVETYTGQSSKSPSTVPKAPNLAHEQARRRDRTEISGQDSRSSAQTETQSTNEETEGMSARPPRARGGRGGVNDQGEEQALWNDFRGDYERLQAMEQRSAVVVELIFEKQERMRAFKDLGKSMYSIHYYFLAI